MIKKISEQFKCGIDRLCFWLGSLIAGIRINLPKNSPCEGEGIGFTKGEPREAVSYIDFGRYRNPSSSIREDDMGVEPQRGIERSTHFGGPTECYIIGPKQMHNLVRESFQRLGIDYRGGWFDSAEAAGRSFIAKYRAAKEVHKE